MDSSEQLLPTQDVVETGIPAEEVVATPTEEADSAKAAEIEREARTKGWRSKDEFKGVPERWAPAKDYLDRWHNVMPLVQRENHTLTQKLTASEQRADALEKRLAVIEKQNEEREQARGEIQQSTLQSEYARALEAGDAQTAARIHTDMVNLAVKAAVPRGTSPAPAAAQTNPDERIPALMKDFFEQNPAFANEEMSLALAEEVVVARTANPRGDPESGLRRAAERARRAYPEAFTSKPRAPAMVETGGRPAQSNGRVRAWTDLKPDVQRHMDELIRVEPSFKSMGTEKARASILRQMEPEHFRA